MGNNKIKVLHISNGFCTSKVHSNLCKSLDSRVERQTIYTYIDSLDKVGKNRFDAERTTFIYDRILNGIVRKIYPLRIWWTFRHLRKKIDPTEFNCIFATTLFSDGGVANLICKKYGIPFIVAVRATDLTLYPKTRLYWKYGRENLLNAKRIILINRIYEEKLRISAFSAPIWDQIKDKIVIRPNGIDSYWLNHVNTAIPTDRYRVCYVGTFIRRKNVLQLIEAIDSLLPEYPNIRLDIVGSKGETEQQIRELAKIKSFIHLYGQIQDKDKLVEIYRDNAIFAMPSLYETFGLVYIEALTQNLRLLYTKGTGIDGLLENVGVAIDTPSVDEIRNAIRKLIDDYEKFDGVAKIDFSYFDWNIIAEQYIEIFNSIIDNK